MRNDWQAQLNNAPRPFDLVSQNLQELGALSIDRYLSASDSDLLVPDYTQPTPGRTNTPPIAKPDAAPAALLRVKQPDAAPGPVLTMQHVARLHQACLRAFGGGEALKFVFVEENGTQSKQCILTITRPDGSARSYQTKPTFSRKSDAKVQAAKIAIDMGALEFIQMGDADALKAKKGFLLSPFHNVDPSQRSGTSLSATEPPEEDKLVTEIENGCIRWRAGEVMPQWFFYSGLKGSGHGAALRIMLSMHVFRVYSSDAIYSCHFDAKAACAKIAVDEGVLDYLKQGNGHCPSSDSAGDEHMKTSSVPVIAGPISLQDFYESLPKPFSELVGDKTASEINGPAWLNTIIQGARGSRLKATFLWLMDRSAGLHGCLLRLERPGQCRSYLVDTRFHKRGDAKAAVSLLAMSQGVGNYIREVGAAAQTKVSHHFKTLAHQHIYPQLVSECEKVRPGNRPMFTTDADRDAFGCTLEVDLSSSAEEPDIRRYQVEPDYRTKADAKVAVACLAAEQGLFELLRFQGQPPPVGHKSFWELHNGLAEIGPLKRKEVDAQDNVPSGDKNKRQRSDTPDGQEVNNGNTKPPKKGSRKKLSASGSSSFVNSVQSGRSTDPDHYGNNNNSIGLYGGPHFFGMAGPSAPFNPLYAPLSTHGWLSNGSYPSHPITTPFQQQDPFAPTTFIGGALYPMPPHDPTSPNYFQGSRVMPPPAPYAPYPQYLVHYPPFPGPGSYAYAPNFSLLPLQSASPSQLPQMAHSVSDSVDPEKHPDTMGLERS
ncbi:hypothetical protein L208DRAFT_1457291 [Tricholoma matsutake]|nr:hypothetical protein L208DRAFT_1457291 [Tricholoma matsutake 945]